jgi:hypothetical protein
MSEHTYDPGFPACGQWETLLADALDGLLRPEDEAVFNAHKAACAQCAALYEEARKGREWLEFLAPEPETPAGLLDRILAQTGPGQVAASGPIAGMGKVLAMPPAFVPASIPVWQRSGFMGQVGRFAEPRLLMTAAMAFFSIALTLNLAGVRLENLRLDSLRFSSLRPSAVRSILERRLMTASTPVVRYYDHLRIRYEVESRLKDLRRMTRNEEDEQIQRQRQKDAAPGVTRRKPGSEENKPGMNAPEQSAEPAFGDPEYLETSLEFQVRPTRSGGSRTEKRERGRVWTA